MAKEPWQEDIYENQGRKQDRERRKREQRWRGAG